MVAYFAPETLVPSAAVDEAFVISISGWRAPLAAQTSSVDRKANSSSPPNISRWMPAPEKSEVSPSASRAWKSAVPPGTARLLMLTIRFCLLWHTILGSAHWSVQFSGTTSCGQSVVATQAPLSIDTSEVLGALRADRRPLLSRLPDEPGTDNAFQEKYDASLGERASGALARCVLFRRISSPSALLARECSLEEAAARGASRGATGEDNVQHSTTCARKRTSTTATPSIHCPRADSRSRLLLSPFLAQGCSLWCSDRSRSPSAPLQFHAPAGGAAVCVTVSLVSASSTAAWLPGGTTSPPAGMNRGRDDSAMVMD
mmetsp:Transcript_21415/g.59445  ORF Transcript_21415/g.59445 Transcript_21415/m.59445 type:complete len:316 (-) Transcript_21415:72-1019(-)